jgi:hypothetical protein
LTRVRKRCTTDTEILAEEQPYLFPLVHDALPIIHAVSGAWRAPIGIGWNQIQWYVPKEEQKLVMTR